MKNILWLLLVVSNISLAQVNREYPAGPVARLTPGKLCDRPSEYRYPEHVAYCLREVSIEQKDQVFANYRAIGFRMSYVNRADYKIDHYIPLCAGGSNDNVNLWPQHISIANVTDSIEEKGCMKMAAGRLSQKDFVTLIVLVKNDNSKAAYVHSVLNRL